MLQLQNLLRRRCAAKSSVQLHWSLNFAQVQKMISFFWPVFQDKTSEWRILDVSTCWCQAAAKPKPTPKAPAPAPKAAAPAPAAPAAATVAPAVAAPRPDSDEGFQDLTGFFPIEFLFSFEIMTESSLSRVLFKMFLAYRHIFPQRFELDIFATCPTFA